MNLENMFILVDGHSIPISYAKTTETRYLEDTGFLRYVVRSDWGLVESVKLPPMGIAATMALHQP
jgi:hypothetical protein